MVPPYLTAATTVVARVKSQLRQLMSCTTVVHATLAPEIKPVHTGSLFAKKTQFCPYKSMGAQNSSTFSSLTHESIWCLAAWFCEITFELLTNGTCHSCKMVNVDRPKVVLKCSQHLLLHMTVVGHIKSAQPISCNTALTGYPLLNEHQIKLQNQYMQGAQYGI